MATLQSIAAQTQKSFEGLLYFHLIPLPNFIEDPEKHHKLHPSISDIITEAKSLFNLAFPIALTALLLYSRSIISMLFLGHLGDAQLAAGSLASHGLC
ncbi:hypothetical protein V6N13_051010 [Hibiscus sabdariffa]|uniref:Uncharacterized protein n=1 Tax=Hibiscus sabdariffa TaxID=183260 RepID=A0ABR2T298_9ROSI